MQEFQKHEYCHKTHTKVPIKSDYFTPNTSMEDFTPGLNLSIYIIEQGVIRERRFVPLYFLLQTYGYGLKDRNYHKFLKSKLTENVTVCCYLWQSNKTDQL